MEVLKRNNQSSIMEIPKGWEFKEFVNFATLSKKKYSPVEDEIRPCIELEHFNQGIGSLNGWTNSNLQKSTKNVFEKGDVLFGKLRPYLKKYWIAEFDGVCSSEVWVLKPKSEITHDFLFRTVQSNKFIQVANVSSGSKMPRADWDYVSEFPFLLPPLPEQQKIAEILSAWDKAIETCQKTIEELRSRNKGLAQQLLSGKINNKNEEDQLKDYHIIGKYVKEVSKRNTALQEKRILSVTNSRGFINQSEQFGRELASADLSNYKIVKKGQFAYNPSRVNVGSLDMLRTFDAGVLSPMYVVFEVTSKDLIPEFLYYHLKTYWFIGHIPMFVQGSVRDTLSFDGFSGMKFYIPTLEEQKKIVTILDAAASELKHYEEKLNNLKLQKKGLMQQLLTGKVRVKI